MNQTPYQELPHLPGVRKSRRVRDGVPEAQERGLLKPRVDAQKVFPHKHVVISS